MNQPIDVIILAGGKGSRMGSDIPKPLQSVGNAPTIQRILVSVFPICARPIVVVGDRAQEIMSAAGENCRYVLQREQRGTGHAVRCVMESTKRDDAEGNIMVLPSDHPLVSATTLRELAESHHRSRAVVTLSTLAVPDFKNEHLMFFDYGRVRRTVRGEVASIVEVKDATVAEKSIKEVNVGYYCFRTAWLRKNIVKLKDRNSAGEFYLTDLVGIAIKEGARTNVHILKDPKQGMGFNTPEQLGILRKYG